MLLLLVYSQLGAEGSSVDGARPRLVCCRRGSLGAHPGREDVIDSHAIAEPSIDPERSPIFVVGTGRSGTTLLRMMLNAHPRIYLTHEASFYVLDESAPRRLDGTQWLERYFAGPRFAWLGLHPDEVRSELPAHLERHELAQAFSAVMRCKARHHGKPRFGDKTPMHSVHLKRLFGHYPDARVVHVVRDPRGAVASLGRMPWGAPSVAMNTFFCVEQLERVRPFRDRILEVRLEDLIATPRPVMERVLRFVGEPWDDAVLDHEAHAPTDDLPPFPWFQAARRNPRPRPGPKRWTQELSPAWVRIIEREHRKIMARYGYEAAPLEHEPGFFERMGARLRDLPDVLRMAWRWVRLLGLYNRKVAATPSELTHALLNLNPGAWTLYPDFEIPDPPEPRRMLPK